jgi:hypothetical protein
MPLSNNQTIEWEGWLIDNLGSRIDDCQKAIVASISARNIPKSTVSTGSVNMWWRKDSRYIDATSDLDGTITATIHIQEYGTSLWIGRAIDSYSQSNYYKRMAASAFVETIDRCIRETVLTMVDASAVRTVTDIGRIGR